MPRTSTPENKESSSSDRQPSSLSVTAPSEKTLRIIMQFARSCRALPTGHPSVSLVNIN